MADRNMKLVRQLKFPNKGGFIDIEAFSAEILKILNTDGHLAGCRGVHHLSIALKEERNTPVKGPDGVPAKESVSLSSVERLTMRISGSVSRAFSKRRILKIIDLFDNPVGCRTSLAKCPAFCRF
jgi:hypothetical protein